jgi:hypothetical protein
VSNQHIRWCCIDRLSWQGLPVSWLRPRNDLFVALPLIEQEAYGVLLDILAETSFDEANLMDLTGDILNELTTPLSGPPHTSYNLNGYFLKSKKS